MLCSLVDTYHCFRVSCWFPCQHTRVELRFGLQVHWYLQVLRFHSSLVEYFGFRKHDTVSCQIPAVLIDRTAWHHILRDVTHLHSSSSYWLNWIASHLRRHDSVTFQQYWLNWMASHLMRCDSVTFQRYWLTELNGITSHETWQCPIPAVLTELNGITSHETWQCHIPAVLTDWTEWHHISGDVTVTFQRYWLTELNGNTPQETAAPLFSTLKVFKSHVPQFYLFISLSYRFASLSWEVIFLCRNMQ
jgi:hypothetical protein